MGDTVGMKRRRRRPPVVVPSGFAGFRFPAEIIMLAVRWYLRYGLSYRDLEELLAECGVDVDHKHFPLGNPLHAAADRRRPAVPPRCR
ncbi:MAG: hypothetical protein M3256_18300 [Actinomycetota bacterium]|nr:hypothetical protein [Actinomycetota bacterium]